MKISLKDAKLPSGEPIIEIWAGDDFITGWSTQGRFDNVETRELLERMMLSVYTKGFTDSTADFQKALQHLIGID